MNRDGKGPQDKGPLTGRGMGFCAKKTNETEEIGMAPGRGMGRGQGRGQGRGIEKGSGKGLGRSGGTGRGMGRK